jgi:SAM-dependent methyltransferase
MTQKSPLGRFVYAARNLRSRALFKALRRYADGDVLDVGGWDFFLAAKRNAIPFRTWTTLEKTQDRLPQIDDERFSVTVGDGTEMEFADGRFDTVLNVQVLEHVFQPILMVSEIGRVLRPGGHAIFLIPQTSNTHLVPDFHCNFSRYWVETAMKHAELELLELQPLGGTWSTMASRFFYFFLAAFRVSTFSDSVHRRNALFYLLLPVMIVYALISIPICMLLSLGDLTEEPNNHLVVARKPGVGAGPFLETRQP